MNSNINNINYSGWKLHTSDLNPETHRHKFYVLLYLNAVIWGLHFLHLLHYVSVLNTTVIAWSSFFKTLSDAECTHYIYPNLLGFSITAQEPFSQVYFKAIKLFPRSSHLSLNLVEFNVLARPAMNNFFNSLSWLCFVFILCNVEEKFCWQSS